MGTKLHKIFFITNSFSEINVSLHTPTLQFRGKRLLNNYKIMDTKFKISGDKKFVMVVEIQDEMKRYLERKKMARGVDRGYIILMAMVSTSETGHAVNLNNYKLLYDTNVGFGSGYNPSNVDIKLPAMLLKWTACDTAQRDLNNAIQASKTPTSNRQDYWDNKSKLVTRVYNEAKSSGVAPLILKDLKALCDKFRGVHHSLPPAVPPAPTPTTISTSHMSYVMRADTFQQIIDLLTPVVKYAPTEADLTIVALGLIYTSMKTMNDNYGTNVVTPVNNARIHRDELFYGVAGMLDNAQLSKDASRAHFGALAAQTHTVTMIPFRRPAND